MTFPRSLGRKRKNCGPRVFKAAKFGWGPYGRSSAEADADQVRAAREGLGDDAELLVDAGTVWVDDVESAAQRLPALQEARVLWLEEPFVSGALDAYKELAQRCRGSVRLAGGEGAHDRYMAFHLMEHGGIGYVQIDAGRVGGISEAGHVLERAHATGVQYVNHTFTSQLALSASLQPFAGSSADWLCEYPVEASPLARDLTRTAIAVDADGRVRPPHDVGLGAGARPRCRPALPARGRDQGRGRAFTAHLNSSHDQFCLASGDRNWGRARDRGVDRKEAAVVGG